LPHWGAGGNRRRGDDAERRQSVGHGLHGAGDLRVLAVVLLQLLVHDLLDLVRVLDAHRHHAQIVRHVLAAAFNGARKARHRQTARNEIHFTQHRAGRRRTTLDLELSHMTPRGRR
jgi:hypothetical protein